MLKRLLPWLMILCLCCPCAMAEEESLPPLNEDGMQSYTTDELLDMMAELPEEGEEDNSSFLVLPEDIDMAEEDVFTILLVGSDSYSNDKRGRSDTIILVRVNAADKTIKMASFLRDMYVKIPGRGSNRINASYNWGGEKLLRKTIEQNFGLTADAYMEVNFERLIQVIDAIGGVEIDVSEKEQKQVNSILRFYNTYTGAKESDQLLKENGLVNLTGKQALCYSRIRKIDGDFQRTNRQRKVIEAAFHKVMQLNLADITMLVMQNIDAVNTDLSLSDVVRLIPMAIRCKNASFETMTVPQEGAYASRTVDGMAVIVPDLKKNKKALREFFGLEGE